jgi:hypothetical protein
MIRNLEILDQKIDSIDKLSRRRHVYLLTGIAMFASLVTGIGALYLQDQQQIVENTQMI